MCNLFHRLFTYDGAVYDLSFVLTKEKKKNVQRIYCFLVKGKY